MRRNIVKYIAGLAAAILAGGLSSCFEGMSDNTPREALELSRDYILVGKDATKAYIGITARKADWTLTGDEEWCRVSSASGKIGITQLTVTFLANGDGDTRKATFEVLSGGIRKEIVVEQLPTDIPLPEQNEEYASNKDIHETIINDWYYWYKETSDGIGPYNQRYDKFIENYLTSLSKNSLDGNKWESVPEDYNERYLYSHITRTPRSDVGKDPLSYGMEFEIVIHDGKMASRILYVMDKSTAAAAGLKRGDWFWKVNDVRLGDWNYNRLIDTLVKPLPAEKPKLGMLTYRSFADILIDEHKSVTVGSLPFRGSPILHKDKIVRADNEGNTTITGHLVYNSFDPRYEKELIEVFDYFNKDDGIGNLILDLRYNKSGTVEMAELMANLIVHSDFAGEVFASYEFNDKHSDLNRTATLTPHPSGVGLKTVYILTSPHTAGAAELLINAFKGLDDMTLVLIGNTTEGMNVGQVKRTYRTDDYQYDVYPAAFRCYNAKGDGDYEFGILPNTGTISEWDTTVVTKWSETWGWKGAPGKTDDQLLLKAMNYVVGNAIIPTGPIIYSSSRKKSGFARTFSVQASMTMDIPE